MFEALMLAEDLETIGCIMFVDVAELMPFSITARSL